MIISSVQLQVWGSPDEVVKARSTSASKTIKEQKEREPAESKAESKITEQKERDETDSMWQGSF